MKLRTRTGILIAAATSVVGLAGCGAAAPVPTTAVQAAANQPVLGTGTAAPTFPVEPLLAAPAGFPARSPMAEEGEETGNDGPEAKIPQGISYQEALAAGLGRDGNQVLTVSATDGDCFANAATVRPGRVWVVAAILGPDLPNEVYVVQDGREVAEFESPDRASGVRGVLLHDFTPGSRWQIACEPRLQDQQIRFPLTVG